jgi:hypothetical protein
MNNHHTGNGISGIAARAIRLLDLVLAGLDVDPVFKGLPGPLQSPVITHTFSPGSVEIHTQKSDTDHSDSDWLTLIMTAANPISKNVQTFPGVTIQLGGSIKSGNTIIGPLESTQVTVLESDVVIVNYLIPLLSAKTVTLRYILMCENQERKPNVRNSLPHHERVDRDRNQIAYWYQSGNATGDGGAGEWSTTGNTWGIDPSIGQYRIE